MYELTQYQRDLSMRGLAILKRHRIVYYAFEMRVGKTLTSFETCRLFGAKRVLFVTKKMAVSSVKMDYRNFKYSKYFDVLIVNHESVHKVPDVKFDVVVVDESHVLGAFPRPSKKTRTLKKVVGSSPVIFLSGTPSPESYSQLYHQLWVTTNSPFKQWDKFYDWVKAGFVVPVEKRISGYIIRDYSHTVKEKIDPYVKKLFVSFTQKQANFEVSELEDEVVRVQVDENIYKLVNYLTQHRMYTFKDGSEVVCDTAVKLQSKIHQICSGTVITETGAKVLDESKALYIKKSYEGRKIAIFYLFDCEGQVLKKHFPNWTNDPMKFDEDDKLTFISQFQSGSRGIDLSSADFIVFYNIHFSSELYQQSRQRGQNRTKKVQTKIHWIFSEGGIEHKVYDAVIGKQNYTLSYFAKDYLN